MDESKSVGGAGRRTLRVLDCIAELSPEFTLSELAAALELPASTVHRLLRAFVDLGMVERSGDRAYRTGTELYRTAALITEKFDLGRIARPALEALWKQWRETVTFSVYRPSIGKGAIVEILRSPNPLQFSWDAFDDFDLVYSPNGQAILSALPEEEVAKALKAAPGRGPLGGAPKPSRRALLHDLETIRTQGYAFMRDGGDINLAGVAAPVSGAGRSVIGSVGLVMPATRFDPKRQGELCASVSDAAGSISKTLGHI